MVSEISFLRTKYLSLSFSDSSHPNLPVLTNFENPSSLWRRHTSLLAYISKQYWYQPYLHSRWWGEEAPPSFLTIPWPQSQDWDCCGEIVVAWVRWLCERRSILDCRVFQGRIEVREKNAQFHAVLCLSTLTLLPDINPVIWLLPASSWHATNVNWIYPVPYIFSVSCTTIASASLIKEGSCLPPWSYTSHLSLTESNLIYMLPPPHVSSSSPFL